MATIGARSGRGPTGSAKTASPLVNTPPLAVTTQYPAPSGVAAMAVIVAASAGRRGSGASAADPKATTVSGLGAPPGSSPVEREIPAGGLVEVRILGPRPGTGGVREEAA